METSTITTTIMFVTGIYLFLGNFLINTENVRSAIFFKVIPATLGLGCIISGLKLYGWI